MKVIATEKAPGAIGPYSQGFLTNGFVYTSGQIPVNPADGTIPEGIAAQAEQSCKNVGAILEAAAAALTRWSRPPASWPTSRILRPSTRFTPSSSPPSPPAAVSPSRTCPRASCARSRPSQRRDPPPVRFRVLHEAAKSQNCAAVWQTSSGFCYFMIGPDALP